jgi:hypothetical protein
MNRTKVPTLCRRARVRYAFARDALCSFGSIDKYACRWAQIHDLSPAGIGLLVGCPFQPGKRVLVQMPAGPFHYLRELDGRVAHATPLGGGTWLIGCAFDRPLAEVEVQAILAGQ